MLEKVGHVRNPLSVIAIFAALAEVSGTIVLPFLDTPLQELYIWFLMLFPASLVLVFFATLNFNRRALYAPSDFREEKHFFRVAEEVQLPRPFDRSPLQQPIVVADLRTYLDAGDVEGAFRYIEAVSDPLLRVGRYKELAKLCMTHKDKPNSFRAMQKYHELRGETPDAYRLLAYMHWWFSDLDTAILQAETGLKLASDHKDKEEVIALKNNLAFYYAEKRINRDIAFRYIQESLDETNPEDPSYPIRVNTQGYVYLKFGNSVKEIDIAIDRFTEALKLLPDRESFLDHLKQGLRRKEIVLHGS